MQERAVAHAVCNRNASVNAALQSGRIPERPVQMRGVGEVRRGPADVLTRFALTHFNSLHFVLTYASSPGLTSSLFNSLYLISPRLHSYHTALPHYLTLRHYAYLTFACF